MINNDEKNVISKVKIDDQVYNIKDNYAREKLRELLGDPKESGDEEKDSK